MTMMRSSLFRVLLELLLVCFWIKQCHTTNGGNRSSPIIAMVDSFNASMESLSHSSALDGDGNYLLFWDFDDSHITLEVRVETLGYVGLGLSPNGGMPGSDVVIAWVEDFSEAVHLTDRHAVSRTEPQIDDVQNYELIYGHQNESHTVIRFRRPLTLCEADDRSITTGTIRVIWAYHAEDPDEDGHAMYHGINRGVKSIFLLDPLREPPKMPKSLEALDLLHQNAKIPDKDTTYLCRSFRIPKFDSKRHVIAAEPVIQEGHESIVHHMVIYGCLHKMDESSIGVEHECNHRNMPLDWWRCTAILQGLAIGGGTMYFPEHVGYPLGTDDDPTALLLEIHYDNPQRKSDIVDSSGIRWIITPEVRANDAGVMVLGSLARPSQIIPPFEEDFMTLAYCTEECYAQAMENRVDEIKVIGTILHTHLIGRGIRLRHFRRGVELEPIAEDMTYDFNLQETRMLPKEIAIRPGDHTMLECHYNSVAKRNITLGGISTSSEMCTAFLFYYPRIPMSVCLADPRPSFLAKFGGLTVLDNWLILAPEEMANKNLVPMLDELVDWKNATIRRAFQMLLKMGEPDSYFGLCQHADIVYPAHQLPFTPPKILVPFPEYLKTECRISAAPNHVITTFGVSTAICFCLFIVCNFYVFL